MFADISEIREMAEELITVPHHFHIEITNNRTLYFGDYVKIGSCKSEVSLRDLRFYSKYYDIETIEQINEED